MSAGWAAVDAYFAGRLLEAEPALEAAEERAAAAGLPPHGVSPLQGAFLRLLVRITGARRVLELGTLGGYSTIWLAGGLGPAGRVVTCELDARCTAVARENLAAAGLTGTVDLRVGPALETLRELAEAEVEPFDLVFLDADKQRNPEYLEAVLPLTRPGSVLVADNVVRDGAVADGEAPDDAVVQGIRRFVDLVAADPRLEATALQTVGEKGHDGFLLARVRAAPAA